MTSPPLSPPIYEIPKLFLNGSALDYVVKHDIDTDEKRKSLVDAKIPRSRQVLTLAAQSKESVTKIEPLYAVDSTVLFMRISVLLERSGESVIDGGGLLYAVTWQPFSTLKQVIYQYYSYVTSNYGISSTVVFDGYIDGPSVKDHEHNRRIMASGAHIQIEHHATKRRSPNIDIGKTSNSLNPHVLKYLLVIQAVSGCDATSAIFDQGKPSIIKLVEKSKKARNFCDILMSSDSTVKEVGGPGIGLLVLMYSRRENDTLSHLRFVNYMKMTATSKKQLQPEKLPPTKRASWFHSLRVYHQICHWKSLKDKKDPLEWGWKMEDGKMSPIMTDQPPAPVHLLSIVRCNCQLTSRNPCKTGRCSCVSHGLKCVAACRDCRGLECNNFQRSNITGEEKIDNAIDIDDDEEKDEYDEMFSCI
ncbi:hypothetical protein GQR58_013491 [Nymphon striatum]|nr:hypothetical protein GQR58_013491 [Nymphon striatum]